MINRAALIDEIKTNGAFTQEAAEEIATAVLDNQQFLTDFYDLLWKYVGDYVYEVS